MIKANDTFRGNKGIDYKATKIVTMDDLRADGKKHLAKNMEANGWAAMIYAVRAIRGAKTSLFYMSQKGNFVYVY